MLHSLGSRAHTRVIRSGFGGALGSPAAGRFGSATEVIPLPFALNPLFVWRNAYTAPFAPDFKIGLTRLLFGRFHGLLGLGNGVGAIPTFSKARDRCAAVVGLPLAVCLRAGQYKFHRTAYRPVSFTPIQAEQNRRSTVLAEHAKVPPVVLRSRCTPHLHIGNHSSSELEIALIRTLTQLLSISEQKMPNDCMYNACGSSNKSGSRVHGGPAKTSKGSYPREPRNPWGAPHEVRIRRRESRTTCTRRKCESSAVVSGDRFHACRSLVKNGPREIALVCRALREPCGKERSRQRENRVLSGKGHVAPKQESETNPLLRRYAPAGTRSTFIAENGGGAHPETTAKIPARSPWRKRGQSVMLSGHRSQLPATSLRMVPSCLFKMNTCPSGPVPKRRSARVAASLPCSRFLA